MHHPVFWRVFLYYPVLWWGVYASPSACILAGFLGTTLDFEFGTCIDSKGLSVDVCQ